MIFFACANVCLLNRCKCAQLAIKSFDLKERERGEERVGNMGRRKSRMGNFYLGGGRCRDREVGERGAER